MTTINLRRRKLKRVLVQLRRSHNPTPADSREMPTNGPGSCLASNKAKAISALTTQPYVIDKVFLITIELTKRTGDPIQSLECSRPSMVRSPLPHDNRSLVGSAIRFYLR